MIRGGFVSVDDRNKLIALARDGSAASRVTRRANALVLLEPETSDHRAGETRAVLKIEE